MALTRLNKAVVPIRSHVPGRSARSGLAEELRGRAVDRIPILKLGRALLVTIQVDMHDRLAMALEEDLTAKIAATQAKGVLIDISALEIVELLHRADARQHCGGLAGARCRDRRGGNAPSGGYHAR